MAHQITLTPALSDYIRAVSPCEDEILRELREQTAELPAGTAMQVPPEEGRLLAFLVGLTRASSVVEVGTFTGYSTLCLARAIGPHGRVVTCDITDRWPDIGRPFWQRAGVAERIEVRIGDAAGTLAGLVAERGPGSVDLVFIDADKAGYAAYFDLALTLVREGGLIIVDNTLYFGRVADPDAHDADTAAIRAFNAALTDDERIEFCLLPIADGISLIRKKEH